MIPGFDISHYQDLNTTTRKVDFSLAIEQGAKFVIVRTSGNVTKDEDFDDYWRDASGKLLRGSYHFFEYRNGIMKSVVEQVEAYKKFLGDDIGELPQAMDFERPNNQWPELPNRDVCLSWIYDFIRRLKKPLLYTNLDTILHKLWPIPDWLKEIPLWVAQYGVLKPRNDGWNTWTFWQFTSTGNGPKWGAESLGVDLDYFNGTEADLMALAGKPVVTKDLTISSEDYAKLAETVDQLYTAVSKVLLPISNTMLQIVDNIKE